MYAQEINKAIELMDKVSFKLKNIEPGSTIEFEYIFENESYKMPQAINGSLSLFSDNRFYLEFNSYDEAVKFKKENDLEDLKIIRKNIDVVNLDKKFNFLENEDCESVQTKLTLFLDIKFPYVYSNKGWKSSYRNMKPILKIYFTLTLMTYHLKKLNG